MTWLINSCWGRELDLSTMTWLINSCCGWELDHNSKMWLVTVRAWSQDHDKVCYWQLDLRTMTWLYLLWEFTQSCICWLWFLHKHLHAVLNLTAKFHVFNAHPKHHPVQPTLHLALLLMSCCTQSYGLRKSNLKTAPTNYHWLTSPEMFMQNWAMRNPTCTNHCQCFPISQSCISKQTKA